VLYGNKLHSSVAGESGAHRMGLFDVFGGMSSKMQHVETSLSKLLLPCALASNCDVTELLYPDAQLPTSRESCLSKRSDHRVDPVMDCRCVAQILHNPYIERRFSDVCAPAPGCERKVGFSTIGPQKFPKQPESCHGSKPLPQHSMPGWIFHEVLSCSVHSPSSA